MTNFSKQQTKHVGFILEPQYFMIQILRRKHKNVECLVPAACEKPSSLTSITSFLLISPEIEILGPKYLLLDGPWLRVVIRLYLPPLLAINWGCDGNKELDEKINKVISISLGHAIFCSIQQLKNVCKHTFFIPSAIEFIFAAANNYIESKHDIETSANNIRLKMWLSAITKLNWKITTLMFWIWKFWS